MIKVTNGYGVKLGRYCAPLTALSKYLLQRCDIKYRSEITPVRRKKRFHEFRYEIMRVLLLCRRSLVINNETARYLSRR